MTIWVVRVGDDLHVRSWKGDDGAWFRATQVRHEGHIKASGVGKDVTFMAQDDADINDQIDAAYRTKYRRHGGRYVDPVVGPTARATPTKLVPRQYSSAAGWSSPIGGLAEHRPALREPGLEYHLADWASLGPPHPDYALVR